MRSQNEEAISSKIVLTEFRTKTCGFCREEALILEELAEVFAGQVEIRMVDAEKDFEMAEKYVVFTVPTLILERDGKLVERWNGFVPGEELEQALRDALRRP
ncbi:MAG TPA: thioredoxin family protein [Methanothrix sp.]|nr:thioredoxin family protein [Methanothrix sp.]HPJ83761.1 thioredoxin family protein [Methanothrix sp.]HPR67208.1 thioredoxin family protein [Methanothrix sp.]